MSGHVGGIAPTRRIPTDQNNGQMNQGRVRPLPISECSIVLCMAIITATGAVIVGKGKEALASRDACGEWDLEVLKVKYEVEQAKQSSLMGEKKYRDIAQLNCNWDFEQSVPFTPRNPEILEFCRDYPKNKIPSIWSELSGHAKDAMKTQAHFEKTKARLADKVSQKPLFCKRGR